MIASLNNVRILVVDDETNIRLMLRTMLQTDGAQVTEASNGREAIDLIHEQTFDLLLLDLNMPILDGLSVLQELHTSPPRYVPRVVVLTAYGSIATAVKATRLGALDFLEKPATPDEIRATLVAVLSEPQVAQSQPAANEIEGGYTAVLDRVRRAMRMADYSTAESLLMKAADLAEHDAAYFNLLGVIYEARQQWRLARKFYGKAMSANKSYDPAQKNLRRLYELHTFGRSQIPATLGDEPEELLIARLAGHAAN